MFGSSRFEGRVVPAGSRSPALARRAMVCTSQPLATEAGLRVLRAGGNAVDAAIAAVAVLGVVEPYNTGPGGDCFLLAWIERERRLYALNGSGRAPARATTEELSARGLREMPYSGILAVTVPGAVDAWCEALERFGTLRLGQALEPAIAHAEEGFPVSEVVAHEWDLIHRFGLLGNDVARACFAPDGHAPRPGDVLRLPDLGRSLRLLSRDGRDAFYRGEIAERIAALSAAEGGLLEAADLAAHRSRWVEPIRAPYRGFELAEVPPNSQGLTALLALGILGHFELASLEPFSAAACHLRIEAVKLAMADAAAYVADPELADVPTSELLAPAYVRGRAARLRPNRAAADIAPGVPAAASDTVYLTAADGEGNVVSLINSLYGPFGCGLVAPGTGIALQNRGRGFRLDPSHPNCIAPGKRPFHTLCPAMLLEGGRPAVSFGVMGGNVQAQAHVQFVSLLVDHGRNVQEALDAPRFHHLGGTAVALEEDFPHAPRRGLRALGHRLAPPGATLGRGGFGGGQAIAVDRARGAYWGGSDRRKDGCALGF